MQQFIHAIRYRASFLLNILIIKQQIAKLSSVIFIIFAHRTGLAVHPSCREQSVTAKTLMGTPVPREQKGASRLMLIRIAINTEWQRD
jgi:hypothetical protein